MVVQAAPGGAIEQAVDRASPSAAARAELARAIAASPQRDAMAIRLARQFSPGFLHALLGSVLSAGAAAVDAIAAGLDGADGMRGALETTLWETALLTMAHGRPVTPERIPALLAGAGRSGRFARAVAGRAGGVGPLAGRRGGGGRVRLPHRLAIGAGGNSSLRCNSRRWPG